MERSFSANKSSYPASILKKRDKSDPSLYSSTSSGYVGVHSILKRNSLPGDVENNNLFTSSGNDIESNQIHPILKKNSLTEHYREEITPKSILKKKSSFEDANKLEKVKPILKKNKSTEEFDQSSSTKHRPSLV